MDGKKKGNGKDKTNTNTTHHCKDPKNHYNHCDINGYTKGECWKLHLELSPKNCMKDTKKKNTLDIDS